MFRTFIQEVRKILHSELQGCLNIPESILWENFQEFLSPKGLANREDFVFLKVGEKIERAQLGAYRNLKKNRD